jgi:AcrR family transcriptional regulator
MAPRDLDPTDGRVVRRAENREAALRSGLALFNEKNSIPSIEDVAEKSGISVRSLYRYFGDASVMIREATELLIEETRPLALFPHIGEGPIADRIATLVAARFRAFEHARPALRATIVNIATHPELASAQDTTRQRLLLQFNLQFAPELGRLDDDERDYVVQAGSAVSNLEFIDMLVSRHQMSVDTAQLVVCRLLTQVLIPAAA